MLCSAGEDDGILAAHFESPSSLLVARGPLAKPTFDRVQLPKGSRGEPALIHLQRAAVGPASLLQSTH